MNGRKVLWATCVLLLLAGSLPAQSIRFVHVTGVGTSTNVKAMEEEAIKAALLHAQSRARIYADLLGFELKEVRDVKELSYVQERSSRTVRLRVGYEMRTHIWFDKLQARLEEHGRE